MGVLRTAKYEQRHHLYLDAEPIKALAILKRKTTLGQNVIHRIGYDPFYVYFWSAHQIKVYNAKIIERGASLVIDATGTVSPKITHVDKTKSNHLFLYTGMLYWQGGSVPVIRQVTECHDATSIADWLKKWLKSGAQYPPEVVSHIASFYVDSLVS